MLHRKFLVLAAVSALFASATIAEENVDARIAASRAAIKDFASTLKGELQSAMKAGGPTNAIEVCNVEAPVIADSVSADQNMVVSRTSLKYRNPDNKPDAWEQQVLEDFEARRAAGEELKTIDYSATVETADGKEFRYMKAIPTAKLCLNCHGTNIAPEVEARLDELYPDDLARGFKEGDIRGAFSITQRIE